MNPGSDSGTIDSGGNIAREIRIGSSVCGGAAWVSDSSVTCLVPSGKDKVDVAVRIMPTYVCDVCVRVLNHGIWIRVYRMYIMGV